LRPNARQIRDTADWDIEGVTVETMHAALTDGAISRANWFRRLS